MKKLSLLLVGLFIVPFVVKAQQGTVKLSGTLFPQVSFLFNNDDSNAGPELDYATTIRFGGGIGVTYGISDYFDVGTEFLISPQGQKYVGKVEQGGVTSKLEAYTKLTYLKVPLVLFFHNDLEETAAFNFMFGPQFNFLIGGQETAKYYSGDKLVSEYVADATTLTQTNHSNNTTTKGTFTESPYNKFLFGAFMGLGVSFHIADNMLLSTILRFDYTFGDVENKNAKLKYEGINEEFDVWAVKPKFDLKNSTPANFKPSDRAKTSAVTGGFNIRFTYVIE